MRLYLKNQSPVAWGCAMAYTITPVIVGAQDTAWLDELTNQMSALINAAVPVLIGLGLALFIWGLVVFISQSGNEQAVTEGKQKMIWGILTLFVIVSVWGLVALLQTLFGAQSVSPPSRPGVG